MTIVDLISQHLTKQNKQVKPLPVPVIGSGRGFEHRVKSPEVVGFSFQKVLKISRISRFDGHCILKNPNLSTECYPIMGRNMDQTVFREITEFFFELFDRQNARNSPEFLRFQDFLWLRRSAAFGMCYLVQSFVSIKNVRPRSSVIVHTSVEPTTS